MVREKEKGKMMDYIVVSEKDGRGYYKEFQTEAEAREFLQTEEYDFRSRTLYDNEEDFIKDWCYTEEEAEERGIAWDDNLDQYTELFNGNEY